jgi:hypothetical protein
VHDVCASPLWLSAPTTVAVLVAAAVIGFGGGITDTASAAAAAGSSGGGGGDCVLVASRISLRLSDPTAVAVFAVVGVISAVDAAVAGAVVAVFVVAVIAGTKILRTFVMTVPISDSLIPGPLMVGTMTPGV